MQFNGTPFLPEQHNMELFSLERREEWSQFSVDGKAGAFCADKINLMNFVKDKMDGNRYLEIGTFDGLTLSLLAESYPDKEFHAIDKFISGCNTDSGCLKYFIENDVDKDNVFLYRGTSIEAIPCLQGLQFDLVFIDADHSYEWVKTDIENIRSFIRPGGIISFHDYSMEGVRDAIHESFSLTTPPESYGDIHFIQL